ncbi:hypothetical protein [Brevundimonas sp.]|uniref:hypothetical protein n=1 Tax=Brevundimonas sp. TaxID=1871086 RepID=UPI0025BB6070|nr:hypothetical protein [Brevundimonas sp.]
MTREERLENENQTLRDKLAQFTGTVAERDRLRGALNLSEQMAGILTLLFKRPYAVPKDTIYTQVFERPDGSGPTPKIVHVQICKLRGRLAMSRMPGDITCAYGTSAYSLTPDLRERLSAIVGGAA